MKSLYTAATGMSAQQMRIENISNNLANVSTIGFKKSRENFEDLLYQNLPSAGVGQGRNRASNLQSGSGVRIASMNKDFRMGEVISTNNNYDLAIASRGFLVVQCSVVIRGEGATGHKAVAHRSMRVAPVPAPMRPSAGGCRDYPNRL